MFRTIQGKHLLAIFNLALKNLDKKYTHDSMDKDILRRNIETLKYNPDKNATVSLKYYYKISLWAKDS